MRVLWLGLVVTMACGGGGGDDDVDPADASVMFDAAAPDAFVDNSDAGAAQLPEDLPDPLPNGAPTVKLATYNVALLQTIKYQNERKPQIVEALKALDADVLCIQEAWNEISSGADISALLADEYPYAMWTWTAENAFGNGLALVSRHPMYQGRELRYEANVEQVVDRVLISATVVTEDSHFNVLCTHLQAFNDPEYLAARQAQIGEIEDYLVDNGYDGERTFLMGDMNCGPTTGCAFSECMDEADTASLAMLEANWTNAANVVGVPAGGDGETCTYCHLYADPLQLIAPTDNFADSRIDHVMYRDLDSVPTSCEIFLDDTVTYTAGGGDVTTQLSDHRGVACSFAPGT